MLDTLMLILGLVLVFGNAVFVAAEFSLVALDQASVEMRAQGGDKRAGVVLRALRSLSTQLSGAQVGITLTNILLGYTTQVALTAMLTVGLQKLGMPTPLSLTFGALTAAVIVNAASILFGELVPKNMALADPMRTAKLTAPLQVGFTWIFGPLIKILNQTANGILHKLGIEPKEEISSARSSSELAALVRHSAQEGTLEVETADLFTRSISMNELTAADVMTDRGRMLVLPHDATAEDLVTEARDTGHSRFPVLDERGENVVSIAVLRKAVAIPFAKRGEVPVSSRSLSAVPVRVPETVGLAPLLVELRSGVQMAVVMDEYGSTAGIVTLEDVVEELVGEVSDEHDRRRMGIKSAPAGGFMVPGTLRPDELLAQTDILVDQEGPYETLGGLVMDLLGRIPKVGDAVESKGTRLEVVAMRGKRVTRLHVVPAPLTEEEEDTE